MTWKNIKTGTVYETVDFSREKEHGFVVVTTASSHGDYVVSSHNLVEVMGDAPEYEVIDSEYEEVTIEDQTHYYGDGHDHGEHDFDNLSAKQAELDEVLIEEAVMQAEAEGLLEQTGPVESGPSTPNLHPYLREMSYNTGTAFVELAEIVNHQNSDESALYHLQAAGAMISDEIRRLSDKEE